MGKRKPRGVINRLVLLFSPYRNISKLILAQAAFETGDFTSAVYRNNNNMFGMKTAYHRVQLGEQGEVASDGGWYQKYQSNTQSLRDFLIYLDYVNFPKHPMSIDTYVLAMKNNRYFTGNVDNYIAGLKRYA